MTVERSTLARVALEMWAETGHTSKLPTRGFSMWPVLRPGDLLSVRHGGAPPEVGQVLVFLDGDRTVAHRVIEQRVTEGVTLFRTKGDTCLAADPDWAGGDRIVGVVEGVVEQEAIVRRAGLQGRYSAFLAALSRAQGLLCLPLHLIAVRLNGGRKRR